MTISFVRAAHGGGTATSATTLTIPFDATGCDALVVGVRDTGATSLITGVAYNGVPLTLARHDGATENIRGSTVYVGKAPTAGVNNLVISFSTSANLGAVVAGFSGVNQSAPVGNVAGHDATAGSPFSQAITVTAGNMAVDFHVHTKGDSISGPAVVGSQTLADGFLSTDSTFYHNMSYLLNATSMGWAWSGPTAQTQSQSVIELKASAVADTAAPTLTSPTSASTGTTTGSGAVTTDEGNGTLYYLASTNATETAATVKASGATLAITSTGSKPVTVSGLIASTAYYLHFLHRDAANNDSTVANSASFTTAAAGDTTAPTLTLPTGTKTDSASATGTVTTNDATGTLYRLASINAVESAATVKAAALTTTVTATGVQTVSFTGLSPSTTYYAHYVHRDPAGNDSTVANSASFVTDAAPGMAVSSYFLSVQAQSSNYADRVRDTTAVTGTGVATLANLTQLAYRTFASAYPAGTARIPYCIEDMTTGAWETGIGTLTTSTTFTRDTVLESSNGNSAVSFAAGTKNIFVTLTAAAVKRMVVKPFIDLRDYPVDPTFTVGSTIGIQAAINDAFLSGVQTIRAAEGHYKIDGPLQSPDGFGRGCNGQLYIPASDHTTGMRHIKIIGEGATAWGYGQALDEPVTTGGVIFESTLTAGQITGSEAAVICASYGYDGGFGFFNYTDFTLENACIRVNTLSGANPLGGLNLKNLANGGFLNNVRVDVNRGLATNPDPTSAGSMGIRTPTVNNSGAFKWGNVFVSGFFSAVEFSEHCFIDRLTIYGCCNGILLGDAFHSSWISMLNVEGCKNSIVVNANHALGIGTYDTEHNTAVAWRSFARDIKYNAGNRKVVILSSTVVAGGVGIDDSGWSTDATSANYKVVAGAGAN
jgi:hypothetical protein